MEKYRAQFESYDRHANYEKYTDLECVLLEKPKRTYKDSNVEGQWQYFLSVLGTVPAAKFNYGEITVMKGNEATIIYGD